MSTQASAWVGIEAPICSSTNKRCDIKWVELINCCLLLQNRYNDINNCTSEVAKCTHQRKMGMRLLLAIFLLWVQFFTIGRPIAGVICLFLQIILIGWIPAAIWSVYALNQYKTDKKIEAALTSKN
jgi:hypothetical protein